MSFRNYVTESLKWGSRVGGISLLVASLSVGMHLSDHYRNVKPREGETSRINEENAEKYLGGALLGAGAGMLILAAPYIPFLIDECSRPRMKIR